MTLNFCTYLDSGYLSRGLALYTSLVEHVEDFNLRVLCMDERAREVLSDLNLSRLSVVGLPELEEADPAFAATRPTRSRIEYYFTATPSWILLALDESDAMTTYVDADVYLFSDPTPIFSEMADASVAIVGHRFPPELMDRTRFGKFNVGWLSFAADADARALLEAWKEQCIDWCYDRLEADRFADQKYLDVWPDRYPFVHVLRHPGINVAPWNVGEAPVQDEDGEARVSDEPLVAFHFHGLRKLAPRLYDSRLDDYGVSPTKPLKDLVYLPYVTRLEAWETALARRGYQIQSASIRGAQDDSRLSRMRTRISQANRAMRFGVLRVPRRRHDEQVDAILRSQVCSRAR